MNASRGWEGCASKVDIQGPIRSHIRMVCGRKKNPKVGVYLKSAEISRRELQSGMEQLTAKPPSETPGAPTNECVADCKCTES